MKMHPPLIPRVFPPPSTPSTLRGLPELPDNTKSLQLHWTDAGDILRRKSTNRQIWHFTIISAFCGSRSPVPPPPRIRKEPPSAGPANRGSCRWNSRGCTINSEMWICRSIFKTATIRDKARGVTGVPWFLEALKSSQLPFLLNRYFQKYVHPLEIRVALCFYLGCLSATPTPLLNRGG